MFKIKLAHLLIVLGMAACNTVMAGDYSVGIVNPVLSNGLVRGIGLNLYRVSEKGIKLVGQNPYVPPPDLLPKSSSPWGPAKVAVTADTNLAYVVYYSDTTYPPVLVQFELTARGLEYRWQQSVETGTSYLDFLSIATAGDYFTYYTNPDGSPAFSVIDPWGRQIIADGGVPTYELISGHFDPRQKFYYSCRYVPSAGGTPSVANTVAVYNVPALPSSSNGTKPNATSTDPTFVRSTCN